jgi:hypothetical protein
MNAHATLHEQCNALTRQARILSAKNDKAVLIKRDNAYLLVDQWNDGDQCLGTVNLLAGKRRRTEHALYADIMAMLRLAQASV